MLIGSWPTTAFFQLDSDPEPSLAAGERLREREDLLLAEPERDRDMERVGEGDREGGERDPRGEGDFDPDLERLPLAGEDLAGEGVRLRERDLERDLEMDLERDLADEPADDRDRDLDLLDPEVDRERDLEADLDLDADLDRRPPSPAPPAPSSSSPWVSSILSSSSLISSSSSSPGGSRYFSL